MRPWIRKYHVGLAMHLKPTSSFEIKFATLEVHFGSFEVLLGTFWFILRQSSFGEMGVAIP